MFKLISSILAALAVGIEAAPNAEPFPNPASKKGLQVQIVDDALELGIHHAALNVNLAGMIDLQTAKTGEGGHAFSKPYLEQLDRQIKPLSDRGVVVSLILLYYKSGNEELNRIMLHPSFDSGAPNGLTAFNLSTPESAGWYRACIETLAERYSRPDARHGRVWNYIVGNEVNSHWFWYNMGRVPMETLADNYLQAVRATHEAVRKHSKNARVYLSLEHHWNIRYPGGDELQAFAGRPFLEYFARKARETGDFDWHVAFHPYPENLFEPRTWNDKSATFGEDTPRITFKNLSMLEQFMASPDLLHKGKPRRIILSEQGFHSADSPEGELNQAAAYCYAWHKMNHLETVDSFILHRHVDHGREGGLNLGLWTRKKDSISTPDRRKKIYEVFQFADSPHRDEVFEFALPIIGIESWEAIHSTTAPR